MAPTPSTKSNLSTPSTKANKTPTSKQRLNFTAPQHPVEVIGRIRDHPELKSKLNALQITGDAKSVRVKTEIGYRDFTLDGVSMSEEDDLEGFYKKFVESRINGLKTSQKCTFIINCKFSFLIVYVKLVKLMGKKAKNATYISGNEAGKILKEIQKVEKRRIIIVDVPTVEGRLMLVDMAGSENIEQAGQTGLEAKMQTAKINKGNIALKRVVESIANGDSHVPFRDIKLTMLLQDSFEDDKSKILMILCASPEPRELHKTIATLEYGAKAKCIVRGPHTPVKGAEDSSSAVIMGSRLAALDQFICKLQIENKTREKERNQAQKALARREEEVSLLKRKLALAEQRGVEASEEEINSKVNERTQWMKSE
ncbi:kinesin-like protein KIN-10A [Salvia splendens]|uniref:kinesin-like protein KIN-10A n=1 Tax=Salvia splendens TaxID=180675 RepID=UPI001C27E730|nr:kinesin-like protein KIN-10A [Salvia splendens]